MCNNNRSSNSLRSKLTNLSKRFIPFQKVGSADDDQKEVTQTFSLMGADPILKQIYQPQPKRTVPTSGTDHGPVPDHNQSFPRLGFAPLPPYLNNNILEDVNSRLLQIRQFVLEPIAISSNPRRQNLINTDNSDPATLLLYH